MNYINVLLSKGSPYNVYRNGTSLPPCHGIIDQISETGNVYIGFSGVVDIQVGDILENSKKQLYHVIYTGQASIAKENDKRIVICEPDEIRQKKLTKKLRKEKMKKRQAKKQREHDYFVAIFSAIIAAIISNFDRIIKTIMELIFE